MGDLFTVYRDRTGPNTMGLARLDWTLRIKEEKREEEDEEDRRDIIPPYIPTFPTAGGGGRRGGGGSRVSVGSATVATVSHRGPRTGIPPVAVRQPPGRPGRVRTRPDPQPPVTVVSTTPSVQISDTPDLSVKNPTNPPVSVPVGTAGGTTQIISTTGNESMDLGQIITELGSAYIGARWGGPTMTPQTSFVDVPFVDVIPEAPTPTASTGVQSGMVYDPNAECGKGKWIKRRRRRRKRLITPTDLNDIAALKAIIGGGQALNAAVIKACN